MAAQFFEGLAKRASNNGHAVDLFAGCLDQVGLLEMKSLTNSTNGVMVLSDSFATSIFKQSFLRIFNKDDQGNLQMGFNATFDVQVRIYQSWCLQVPTIPSRQPKSSGSQASSVTPFRRARNPPALAKRKLALARLPHGRSISLLLTPLPPFTSKWSLPLASPSSLAHVD
jgi:hypothetical protein